MKNFIILLFLLAGLSSCKKEYTCDCTVTTSNTFTVGSTTTTSSSSQGKLNPRDAKDAKKACEAGNGTSTIFFATTIVDCKQVKK